MLRRLVLFVAMALSVWVGSASAYSGSCGIWANKRQDYYSKPFSGDQTGYNAALAYVGTYGTIFIYPGCDGNVTVGSVPDSVAVIRFLGGRWVINGTVTTPRLGPYSTATTGGAVRIIDGTTFVQSRTGVNLAVQEVIAAGGGLVLMTRGRYRWDQNVTLNNAVGVTIEGVGDSTALWGDYSTGDDAFRVTGTSNGIVFRNFSYDGDQQNNNAGRGIDVESATSRDITIDGVTIRGTNDAAIASQAPRTIIRYTKVYSTGDASAGDRTGIRLYGSGTADSCEIGPGNVIVDSKDSNLSIDANSDYTRIYDNRFINAPGASNAYNVTVCAAGGKFIEFRGNHVEGADNAVLAVFGSDSTRISDNTFTKGRIYSGLYLLRGKGVIVSNNICTANVHFGIFVGFDQGDCSDVLVTGNFCGNNQGGGIVVNPSTTRTFTTIAVAGNMCVNNGGYGVTFNAASFASTGYVGNNVLIGNATGPASLSATNWTYQAPSDDVGLFLGSYTNATLGTPPNGTIRYCSDCTKATPCAGGGTGSFAFRKVGAWDCNP